MTTLDWQKRAYSQLMYAFMLQGTVDWYLWGMGWSVIEAAPAEVVPPLPCEPNWRALPTWVRWWAIDGDGTIRGFHFKPMGWVERKCWMLGAHGPPMNDKVPIQMHVGHLGSEDAPAPVFDWWMTLRRRPYTAEELEPEDQPVSKQRTRKSKKRAA